jgi:uncharacterized protein YndB with AHSA1/START domain
MGAESADFVYSRVLDAPRERVWQALTEIERIKVWWPPKTFSVIAASLDLRPGGVFHCGIRSFEGYKVWGKFVYREVAPPERLVYVNSFSNEAGELKRHPIVPTWPAETMTVVTLEDEPGGKTRFTVRWTPHNPSEIERKTFDMSHIGMRATWGASLDQLTAYLAQA